jgi:hypothetical protein
MTPADRPQEGIRTMTTPNITTPLPEATPAQQRAFRRLRELYQHDHDLFTPQEWRRLEFLRWLHAEAATSTHRCDDSASTASRNPTLSSSPWIVRRTSTQ